MCMEAQDPEHHAGSSLLHASPPTAGTENTVSTSAARKQTGPVFADIQVRTWGLAGVFVLSPSVPTSVSLAQTHLGHTNKSQQLLSKVRPGAHTCLISFPFMPQGARVPAILSPQVQLLSFPSPCFINDAYWLCAIPVEPGRFFQPPDLQRKSKLHSQGYATKGP